MDAVLHTCQAFMHKPVHPANVWMLHLHVLCAGSFPPKHTYNHKTVPLNVPMAPVELQKGGLHFKWYACAFQGVRSFMHGNKMPSSRTPASTMATNLQSMEVSASTQWEPWT
jgi:hypothetical protein